MATLINLPARKLVAPGGRGQDIRYAAQPPQQRWLRHCEVARSTLGCHRPPAFTSARTRLQPGRTTGIKVSASAAGAAQPSVPDETPSSDSGPVAKFKALLSPFSEPSTNKKLLALCGAQALSSVATLIHDTYLPLYLSEELKLSNTKVRWHQQSTLSLQHSKEAAACTSRPQTSASPLHIA